MKLLTRFGVGVLVGAAVILLIGNQTGTNMFNALASAAVKAPNITASYSHWSSTSFGEGFLTACAVFLIVFIWRKL